MKIKPIRLVLLVVLVFSIGSAVCPPASTIAVMKVTSPGFAEAGPYDSGKIKPGKVFVLENGRRIKICLANVELKSYLSVDALGAQKLKPGEFALILNLSNGASPVVAGTYSPKAGYGEPFWATAEILTGSGKAGTFFSIAANEGHVRLLEFSAARACGSFDLSGYSGQVKGEFLIVR
jgi:hypothetical protein